MEENQNQITLVKDEVSRVTKEISSIKTEIIGAITDNSSSLRSCLATGETLLLKAERQMTDETDAEIASYIKKSKATVQAMSERRKGVTQVFDMVRKGFTTMEGLLDPKRTDGILYKLQVKRNEYAAWKLEQQRKAEEERQRLIRVNAQKVEIESDTLIVCSDILSLMQQQSVAELRKMFSDLTLANKDDIKTAIENYSDVLKIGTMFKHSVPEDNTPYGKSALHITVDNYLDKCYPDLSEDEIKTERNASYKACHAKFEEQYKQTISATKQELLDTFDSKIAELEEAKRLEEERKRKEEEARRLEEERRRKEEEARKAAEEAKKIADGKARKEAEAEAARKTEEARKAEEERKRKEEEARKAEEERLKHEAEVKAAEEAAAKEQAERLKAEAEARAQQQQIEKARVQAQTLFDQTSSSVPVKAKVSKHIEVYTPSAFLDIMQLWWAREGSQMTVEDLTKKLGFMIKTAEKAANKDDVIINNKGIRYVEDVTAK